MAMVSKRDTESRGHGPAHGPAVDQGEVIAFLSRGQAYGLPDQPVERIDTHAAVIFLIGDRAYKLKRAVRYSFLDFSTIHRRHRILDAEYRLNVRTAPKLYRRLIPVTAHAGHGLALDGEGTVVDWLLEMGRFDQSALLDRQAEEGKLDTPLMVALAAEIADLHQKAPIRYGDGHAAMASVVKGNADDLASLADEIGREDAITSLIDATGAALSRQKTCLDRRADAGFTRHCHGDLHLGNIFLDGDRPVLFDCLEFDERLATIDVFYDLAFLLMDLCHRGLDDLAIDLLGAYLDRTEDDGGTALLPLFLGIRATIRAKIEGFEIKTARSATAASTHRQAALQYLDLATDLLSTEPGGLIAIGGLSGSGKSTVAKLLARRLGRRHWPILLRSDVIRKHLQGVTATTRLGGDAYSSERTADVYQHLRRRADTLLQAGRTVIADATFLDPADRKRMEDLALKRSVPFHGIWLSASQPTLERRLKERRGDASDADINVLAKQRERDFGVITWTKMDAGAGAERVASKILSHVTEDNGQWTCPWT